METGHAASIRLAGMAGTVRQRELRRDWLSSASHSQMTQLAEHSGQFSLDGQRAAETMHKLLDMPANMEKNIAVSY